MDTGTRTPSRLHPLVAVAAVSVIGLSATGIGALIGVFPSTLGSSARMQAVPAQNFGAAALVPAAAASVPSYAAATQMAAEPLTSAPPATPTTPTPKAAPRKVVAKTAASTVIPNSPPQPVQVAAIPTPPPPAAAPVFPPVSGPVAAAEAPRCLDCGIVESVREVEQKGEGSWIGPVAGGVGGAILGKQMGKGTGNTIMTVLGAAGGAFAGREIEKHVRTTKRWDVQVRMGDGTARTVSYTAQPQWHAGEKVRLENGALVADRSA